MKLTEQHIKAVQLLASGHNGNETAEKLGVRKESISRWRQDHDFQAELNRLLKQNEVDTQNRLRSLVGDALATIQSVMNDPDAPHRDRVQAAVKVLEMTGTKPQTIGSEKASVLRNQKELNDSLEDFSF